MLDRLLDALYPRDFTCALCGAECVPDARGLCAKCAGGLPLAAAVPLPQYIDGITAGLAYGGAARNAVMRLKYEGCQYLAPFLAQYIEIDPEWRADAIIPVPLHKSRERSRGYNQSLLLANAVSSACGIPVDAERLVRIKATATQTAYRAAARRRNVKNAFACRGFVPYEAVVLVDDVCTTGSTVSQCARTLKRAGVERVYAAVVCHV